MAEPAAQLLRAAVDRRLHHALLITGVEGIGKLHFCQWLAEALLCRTRTAQGACGHCAACKQLLASSHPDFLQLLPEGANAGVKVDAVRELVNWLQLTADQHGYRVALITQANGLNRFAANSLLKTLEEPADNAVLILCADRVGALPATVRSRCRKITLSNGHSEAAVQWLRTQVENAEEVLAESGGRPFTAVQLSSPERLATQAALRKAWSALFLHQGSVSKIAESLSDFPTTECLSVFTKWTMAAVKQTEQVSIGLNPADAELILSTQPYLHNEQWFTLHDRLLQLHRSDSASFKTQTVLEGIFADIRLMIKG